MDDGHPILVYQMGKVGSSTVVESLKHQQAYQPVLHIHTLDRSRIESASKKIHETSAPWQDQHLVLSRQLLEWPGLLSRPLKVVTIVREPVSRAISHVFETWRSRFPEAESAGGVRVTDAVREVGRLLREEHQFFDPSRWFDHEIKQVFGVDVFAQPFDYAQGFNIVREGRVEVLVLRTEDLNLRMHEALGAFLGLPMDDTRVEAANRSGEKQYGPAMKCVRASLRLDGATMRRVVESRLVRHFYADRVEELTRRWSEEAEPAGNGWA
ncbi:MAG: hypothetical protein KDK91_32985 [Gammaproteobacteria bacterium]|nr:hypothetical protein [Gammaproteobacteria bacterium]